MRSLSFQSEAQNDISENKELIDGLDNAINEMPQTITISTRQVKHRIFDEHARNTSEEHSDDEELLEDIIQEQEQKSFVQDENMNTLNKKFDKHCTSQNEKNTTREENINDVITWKESQKNVDLVTMRKNQDSMKDKIDNH